MPSLEDCTLHYLNGRIDVDIVVASEVGDHIGAVLKQIQAVSRDDKVVGRVRLLRESAPK